MQTIFDAFRDYDRNNESKKEIHLIAEETLPEIEESECDDNVSGESNFANEYDDDDEVLDDLEDKRLASEDFLFAEGDEDCDEDSEECDTNDGLDDDDLFASECGELDPDDVGESDDIDTDSDDLFASESDDSDDLTDEEKLTAEAFDFMLECEEVFSNSDNDDDDLDMADDSFEALEDIDDD